MFDALAFDASAFDALPDVDPDAPWFEYLADNADPNYDTTTTTGGIVDTSDRGQPNAIPATTAVRPTRTPGGANGHAYLAFDGVDDRLNTSNLTGTMLAFGNDKPGLTLSVVVRLTTTALGAATKTLVFFTVGASNSTRIAINVDATGAWNMSGRRLDTEATVNLTGPTADTTLHHLVAVNDYASQQQRLYLDGTLVASQTAFTAAGNSSATDGNAWMWGANATPAQWVPAEFYELKGYDRALTTAEIAPLWSDAQTTYALAQGTQHPLTASGTATSSGSAAIDAVALLPLTATGTATSSGSAAIVATRPLTASGQATSSGSAALVVPRPLVASGAATSSGSAAIGQRRAVTATGVATSSGSAAIVVPRPLTATGTSQTTGTAQLVGDAPLSGIGTAVSSGSAAIVVPRPLTATGAATSTGSAAIGRARPVTASGSATSSGSGALGLRRALVANGTALTLGGAEVTLRLALGGSAMTTSDGSASITLGGFPQYQPGTSVLRAAPLGVAVLVVRPAARATLTPRPAATAILGEPKLATATLTTEG